MTLRQILEENPHFIDYQVCLSQFFVIDKDESENTEVVADFPVLGIASNDEEKELRFLITVDDFDLLKKSKMKIIHLLDQKLAEITDSGQSDSGV